MKPIVYLSHIIPVLFLSFTIQAQQLKSVHWSAPAHLPPLENQAANPGIAGAFAGLHGDKLIIAGGANFPEGMPWEGGRKKYADAVYVLSQEGKADYHWYYQAKLKLASPVAYGASVTTGEGIVCIGGENEKGISQKVFLLQWKETGQNIIQQELPSLPFPLTNAAALLYRNTIYVAGGETTGTVSDQLISLDMTNSNEGWKMVSTLPAPVSHAVWVLQVNENGPGFYLIGGRRRTAGGTSELYHTVYRFDPVAKKWEQQASLPYALSAGTGLPVGRDEILLFGGDRGIVFHKTEVLIAAIAAEKEEGKKQELVREKNQLQATHPGFSRDVLCFNTRKQRWKSAGKIPYPAPVTSTAVQWHKCIVIPSGEIKAGVRTSQVLVGKLRFKN